MFLILRPLRLLFKALVIESTPTQMSYGLALGVLMGIVPKGNLLAIVLGFCVAAMRVNLAITACAAVILTFASSWFDTAFDQVGVFVLGQPSLRGFWEAVYDTPMMRRGPILTTQLSWAVLSAACCLSGLCIA